MHGCSSYTFSNWPVVWNYLVENGCTSLFEGDDRSESSESTSGCSSLVPQANRQSQASESVMNSLSGRRRSIDEKLNFSK
jgi:hypothetical protein